ncbi:DUF418 domain-containing protein [Luteimonas kalidii]|uniref:DUF418 domain-containing protein n=1 Tax=Luteimonas kalidii TaxID=3042025 RepID=A0ABT6JPC6_9GAMM|nr:DUF418 domain-containing protein [Luteimonas kalidii]MDH5832537.1 DUF418 domain-containing protein [Luteimonas kalidii]
MSIAAPPPLPPRLPAAPAPTDSARRLQALDVVRGFALLGIFLMNIEWFSRPLQAMGTGIDPAAAGLDRAAAWAVYVFVQGKFWVLFSLLFGMGFALMSARGGQGPAFRRTYVRRCVALLGFGVLHATLLWSGDILHAYAIAGLMLLALDGIAERAWPWLGAGLYATLALVVLAGGAVLSALPPDAGATFAALADEVDADAAAASAALAHGDWWQATAQRARDFLAVAMQGLMMLLPMALGVFMLGAWLLRSGRMDDPVAQRGWFARLAAWTLPTGAVLMALSLSVGTRFDGMREAGPMLLANGLAMLASLPLALGYLSLLMLGLGTRALARPLSWLAPAGRMALTHYLLQSLVASTLFYGYGLGLWGQVGRAGQVLLVLVVFALQVAASHWWLARFRFGPMEWLWRWLSYGARPPMRVR